jgi:hypothetical protein
VKRLGAIKKHRPWPWQRSASIDTLTSPPFVLLPVTLLPGNAHTTGGFSQHSTVLSTPPQSLHD